MATIQELSSLRAPIKEDVLKDVAKMIGSIFKSHAKDEETEWAQSFLGELFATASDPSLSSTHCTAACNVLCGSISQCLSDPQGRLALLVRSRAVCRKLFSIYMDKYDGAKAKSMEQVLSTLIKLLSSCSLHDSNQLETDECILHVFKILFETYDKVKAKRSLHALTLFLSKDLIDLSRLLEVYREISSSRDDIFSQDKFSLFQDLLFRLFEWVSFADAASGVGQLCSILIRRDVAERLSNDDSAARMSKSTPVWAGPLLRSIRTHKESLRDFKHSVFPSLFRANADDYWGFLQYLNIDWLLRNPNGGLCGDPGMPYDSAMITDTGFAALEVGKEVGVLHESDDNQVGVLILRNGMLFMRNSALEELLNNASASVRLAALTLLVCSKQSTRPYSSESLRILQTNIPHLHADTDASFRGEVISLIQTLVYRLRNIVATLAKSDISHSKSAGSATSHKDKLLEAHILFVKWYIDFVADELRPSASYQRHISGLKVLNVFIQSGLDTSVDRDNLAKQAKQQPTWPIHELLVGDKAIRGLVDRVVDAFEDVRQEASDILKRVLIPDRSYSSSTVAESISWSEILTRGSAVATQNGRIDTADGIARLNALSAFQALRTFDTASCEQKYLSERVMDMLHELVAEIETALQVLKIDFYAAIEKWSIHSLLTTLRYVFDSLRHHLPPFDEDPTLPILLGRMTACVRNAWDGVSSFLCNDAPEGFRPEGMNHEANITTRDVSSYAWRTAKESSLLLRILTSETTLEVCYHSPLRVEDHLRESGDFCFRQLADLRHRGAFATVALTFDAICYNCGKSQYPNIRELLGRWYEQCLFLIEEKGSAITRRSAGIPPLITSILAADLTGEIFESAMMDLKAIAMRHSISTPGFLVPHLPQVHALNSLKTLLMNAKLAERSENHVVSMMEVAARCLGSERWAIRNCGLMLFRGLVDRLLGSHEKFERSLTSTLGIVSRLSYDAYPGLIDLALRLLQDVHIALADPTDCSSSSVDPGIIAEAIFPILDLLRRAPPPSAYRSAVQELALKATGSAHWHIRELAARTFVASIKDDEISTTLEHLLTKECRRSNELHGYLLCIKALADALLQSDASLGRICQVFDLVAARIDLLRPKIASSQVAETFLQILNSFGKYILVYKRSAVDNDALLHDLCQSFYLCSHELQSVAFHGNPSKQALELNSWLAYLSAASVPGFEIDDKSRAIEDLFDGPLREATLFSIFPTLDIVLQGASPSMILLFVETVAKIMVADHPRDIYQACETTVVNRLVGFSSSTVYWISIQSLKSYIRDVAVVDRFYCAQSPSSRESAVKIWGLSLCLHWTEGRGEEPRIRKETDAWMSILQDALHESNCYEMRYAAVQSILAFVRPYQTHRLLPAIAHIRLALTLYDAVNDDDPEIRQLAAEAISVLIGSAAGTGGLVSSTIPPVAAQKLCTYLLQAHPSSPALLNGAITRLIPNHAGFAQVPPVKQDLERFLVHKSSLFEEERCNLYKDEIREIRLWFKVLLHLSFEHATIFPFEPFAHWVLEGLDSLTVMARQEYDGPLGWTSGDGVFILGIRVIASAKIVLSWRSKSMDIHTWASKIYSRMEGLVEAGRPKNLHKIWLDEIEQALREYHDKNPQD